MTALDNQGGHTAKLLREQEPSMGEYDRELGKITGRLDAIDAHLRDVLDELRREREARVATAQRLAALEASGKLSGGGGAPGAGHTVVGAVLILLGAGVAWITKFLVAGAG
jgi:hypothetical protein